MEAFLPLHRSAEVSSFESFKIILRIEFLSAITQEVPNFLFDEQRNKIYEASTLKRDNRHKAQSS